ncbi:MAG: glycosyltransferase family 2 protein [Acidobacteriota bacterium]
MSEKFAASIIVPTKNRADLLKRFLPAFAEQETEVPYEVIIVNNHSTDATAAVVLEATKRWSHIRTIEEQRSGGARCRHAGALAARSPILIFVDDDMLVEPQLVAEHLKVHETHPDSCVLGNIISAVGTHPFDRMMAYIYDGPKSTLANRKPTAFDFWSGNLSMARDLYFRLGGYSEELAELRCGEDMEFGLRLTAAGMEMHFAPKAIAHHHFTERFKARLNRSYRIGIAYAYLRARHPELQINRFEPVKSRLGGQALEMVCLAAARLMEPFDNGKGVPIKPLALVYDLGLQTATKRGIADYGARRGKLVSGFIRLQSP